MGCMLSELPILSSGFRFDNSNYNYTNTNTNVSSHLCENECSIDPASKAKNNLMIKGAGTSGERDLLTAKP